MWANKVLSQSAMRQKYPCYIIARTVDRNQWWDGAPLAALTELIKSSLKKCPIDPARIYVTGQSMGGTYSAILKEPHLFAAAVPVCGRGQTDLAKKIVPLPIWIFYGANDQVIPTRHSREYGGGVEKGRRKADLYRVRWRGLRLMDPGLLRKHNSGPGSSRRNVKRSNPPAQASLFAVADLPDK